MQMMMMMRRMMMKSQSRSLIGKSPQCKWWWWWGLRRMMMKSQSWILIGKSSECKWASRLSSWLGLRQPRASLQQERNHWSGNEWSSPVTTAVQCSTVHRRAVHHHRNIIIFFEKYKSQTLTNQREKPVVRQWMILTSSAVQRNFMIFLRNTNHTPCQINERNGCKQVKNRDISFVP